MLGSRILSIAPFYRLSFEMTIVKYIAELNIISAWIVFPNNNDKMNNKRYRTSDNSVRF